MTSIPLYRHLRFKLVGVFSLLVLLVTIFNGITAIKLAEGEFFRVIRGQFHSTLNVTDNFFNMVGHMALVWGNHFSLDKVLVSHLETGDMPGLRRRVSELRDESRADVAILVDSHGRVLYHSGNPRVEGGSLMSWAMVRKAIMDQKVEASVIQDFNSLIIYAPALIQSAPQGEAHAVVLVGYVINDALLANIHSMTDIGITIVRRRGVMASTYNSETERLADIPINYLDYQTLLADTGNIGHMRIRDTNYFTSAQAISMMDPAMEGSILISYPKQMLTDIRERLVWRYAGIFLIGLLIVLFLGFRLSKQLLSPLRNLQEYVLKVMNGEESKPIEIDSKDEIGVLARQFNTMVATIDAQNRDLRIYSEDLEKTVVERTRKLSDAVDRLATQELSLMHAQRIASLGSWEWEGSVEAIVGSREMHRLLGFYHEGDDAWKGGQRTFAPLPASEFSLAIHEKVQRVAVEGRVDPFECQIQGVDGKRRILYCEMDVRLDERNRPLKARGITQDITQRKYLEDAIRNIAAGVSIQIGDAFFKQLVLHLAKLFDADYAFVGLLSKEDPDSIDSLAVCDHGRIADNFTYKLPGSPCATVVGKSLCAYPDNVQGRFPDDHLLQEMNAESYLGTSLYSRSGKPLGIVWVLDSKPLRLIEQYAEILEIFAARISSEIERINAERKRIMQEREVASILENIVEAVLTTDEQGRVLTYNPAAEEMFGYAGDEIIGRNVELLMPEPLRSRHVIKVSQYVRTGESTIMGIGREVMAARKSGETFPVRLSVASMPQQDGKHRFIASIHDISEEQRKDELLRRAQKMEAVGQLTGGIAHDFNNQLGVVTGYLGFLDKYLDTDGKPRHWVDAATKATNRCIDLTRQLLSFTRRRQMAVELLDINTVIREMHDLIVRSVTPEVRVNYALAEGLWPIAASRGELEDALLNMVINARDAMPDGGQLSVVTENRPMDPAFMERYPMLSHGDYIQIVLADTGSGMNKAVQERVFEPFFTTKDLSRGTGLGMPMVYGFVERNKGLITLDSTPGEGTSIHILLPRAEQTVAEDPTETPSAIQVYGKGETILVVDDEAQLLSLAEEYLRTAGYTTITAGSGAEALAILATEQQVDLLFSDVIMPGGLNGFELAEKAVGSRPNLRVLLTSGYTAQNEGRATRREYAERLLSKPYSREDLLKKIYGSLDGGPPLAS